MSEDPRTVIWFGDVSLDTRNRELRRKSRTVRIDRRACDVLEALIDSRDRALLREEIMERVWPGTCVAPGSVTVQVHALRQAFRLAGCRAETIRTLRAPARYQFCLEVTAPPAPPQVLTPPAQVLARVLPLAARPWRQFALIGVAAMVLVAGLAGAGRIVLPHGSPPPLSIAVEPFADLGPGPAGRDLAGVLTSRLIGDLAGMPGVSIAAASADAAARPPQAIGQALRVRFVLAGSLTSDAGQMHVTYGLIDSSTGVQVDGSSFTLPEDQVQAAGQLILRRISVRLHPQAPGR
jgi:TolB-like protein